MRIYAEANFVLEIAFEQEEHRACDELMRLAEAERVELVLLAYAFLEPRETLVRREKAGNALRASLDTQALQLARTASLSNEVQQLQESSRILLRASDDAKKRIQAAHTRLIETARVVATDDAVLREAPNLATRFKLALPDAVMLTSVLKDATDRPAASLFFNRNFRDFLQPDIIAKLKEIRCEMIPSFDAGLARVRSTVERAPSGAPPPQ